MSTEDVNRGRREAAERALRLRTVRRVVSPPEPRSVVVKRWSENIAVGVVAGLGARTLFHLWRR